jgi:NAD(P)-dependent dehydrogenase (short-subunit alcohol dehydrogenase family)
VSRTTARATTRTAVVTGAARGIGAAAAQRLASDGCAVAVVISGEAHAVTSSTPSAPTTERPPHSPQTSQTPIS